MSGNELTSYELALFKMTSSELLAHLRQQLAKRNHWKILTGKEFVYSTGNIPVLLIAHVDTVHAKPPEKLFYDRGQGILWSPEGLGADDRAGVIGILRLLNQGYAPHVLFTDGEECGATGAKEAVRSLADPGVLYAIELDRRHAKDAVFYDCNNPVFTDYVTSFGFKEASGSFSDISVICPKWRMAGVNVSCGYYNEHTRAEFLNTIELNATVTAVAQMLRALPNKRFRYYSKYAAPTTDKTVKVVHTSTPHMVVYSKYYNNRYYASGYNYDDYDDLFTIAVELLVDELVAAFGGDPNSWIEWLYEHIYHLEEISEKAIWEWISDKIAMEIPDFILS